MALSGGLLAFAIARDEARAVAALRSPPVAALGAIGLALLSSTLWTIGDPADALRAGLVTLALAAIAAASAVLCGGARGAPALATVFAIVAGLAALAGLAGVVLRVEPWAERIGGAWRPGGPFEYPPALALLQVSALPLLLCRMTSGRTGPAILAACGGSLGVAAIALSDSRLQAALGAAILLTAVALPRRTLATDRRTAMAAAGVLAVAAIAAEVLLGGYAHPGVTRGGGDRLLELACVVGGATAVWAAVSPRLRAIAADADRPLLERRPLDTGRAALTAAVLAALAAGSAAVAISAPVEQNGGFAHGRLDLWSAAIAAAADRPLLGYGAETFLAATGDLQDGAAIRFAHNLPLELATELGLLGFALALALYAACARALSRVRDDRALWLLGPATIAFLVAGLLDWEWHFAASGSVFAAALGVLVSADERPT